VDEWGRAHDVANLFASDGSVMTTSAAANPTLAIVALAMRQADHIVPELARGSLLPGDRLPVRGIDWSTARRVSGPAGWTDGGHIVTALTLRTRHLMCLIER